MSQNLIPPYITTTVIQSNEGALVVVITAPENVSLTLKDRMGIITQNTIKTPEMNLWVFSKKPGGTEIETLCMTMTVVSRNEKFTLCWNKKLKQDPFFIMHNLI